MHPLLERQIKKTLGDLDPLEMTSGWQRFFELVSNTYYSADEERAMLDRSLDISSKEYADARDQLTKESAKKDVQLQEVTKDKESHALRISTLESEIAQLERKIPNIESE